MACVLGASLLVARTTLRDRLALLRYTAWTAHDDAVLLDDVPRIGAPVLLALNPAARVVIPVERMRIALLPRGGRLAALPEEPLEHARG